MNRRGFLGSLAALAVVPFVKADAAPAHPMPGFDELNFIDLPEPITALQECNGSLLAFTVRHVYEIEGCYGPFETDGPRFWARDMPLTDSLPRVIKRR